MASAWGASWGSAWGPSWGATGAPVKDEQHNYYGSGRHQRDEELAREDVHSAWELLDLRRSVAAGAEKVAAAPAFIHAPAAADLPGAESLGNEQLRQRVFMERVLILAALDDDD